MKSQGGRDQGVGQRGIEQSIKADHGLKEDLDRLLARAAGGSITLGEMIEVMGDRAHAALILIVASPFLVIPVPGFSTVVGLLLALLSVAIGLNVKPWLPRFLAGRQLSHQTLSMLVHGADRVLGKAERWCHPRMGFMVHGRSHALMGLTMFMLCIALALPIPIPGNNVPPAIGIVMLALGMLERDGLMVLAAHIYNLLLWIALAVFGAVIYAAVMSVWARYSGPLLRWLSGL